MTNPRSVPPLLLRAWHCFYQQEPPYRDPFTTGDAYEDRLDAATLASLARVLRLAGIADESLEMDASLNR